MSDSFTLDTFQPLIGSSFVIAAGPGSAFDDAPATTAPAGGEDLDGGSPADELERALVLVEASALGSGDSRDPFSLLFLRHSDVVLLDETYTLSHPSLGSFRLFIVPVAQDAEGVRYEAIFN